MSSFRFTDQAEADLLEIALYIARDSLAAAERLVDRVHQKCEMLAENPGSGAMRDELAPGLRSFPVGNYLIFYRRTDRWVEVVRVLSGFRDIEAQFGE